MKHEPNDFQCVGGPIDGATRPYDPNKPGSRGHMETIGSNLHFYLLSDHGPSWRYVSAYNKAKMKEEIRREFGSTEERS